MKKKINFYCLMVFISILITTFVPFGIGTSSAMTAAEQSYILSHPYLFATFCLITLVCAVWMLVKFVKLIVRFNRNEIFSFRNAKTLTWLGVLQMVNSANVLAFTGIFFDDLHRQALVEFGCDLTEGFFLLIMGEAFRIGLRLQEDQELTI